MQAYTYMFQGLTSNITTRYSLTALEPWNDHHIQVKLSVEGAISYLGNPCYSFHFHFSGIHMHVYQVHVQSKQPTDESGK
jgi:hypothetical protein